MRLSDYVTLLRSGMTLDEIRQRETEEATEPEPQPEPQPQPEPEPEPEPESQPEPEPDYKALYEQSQKDLKTAQQANVKQNIKDDTGPSDEELFSELVASFM